MFVFEEKCCWNELSLPSFTFCGNNAVTITIVSAKFPGLQESLANKKRTLIMLVHGFILGGA